MLGILCQGAPGLSPAQAGGRRCWQEVALPSLSIPHTPVTGQHWLESIRHPPGSGDLLPVPGALHERDGWL